MTPNTMQKKYDTRLCRLLQKRQLTQDIFDFTLSVGSMAEQILPGQFAHVYVPSKTLRRPISICDADPSAQTMRMVFQIRGDGTDILSKTQEGASLDILFPLGHGFQLGDTSRRAVFIGGGIGVPPLLFAARQYGAGARVILGFHSRDAVILTEDFSSAGCRTVLCTDDGTAGRKGFVTAALEDTLASEPADILFACGPLPMLKGVAGIAGRLGIPCQVSLEERMACGVGACLGCAVKTTRPDAAGGYSHVCKDGPVFDAQEVVW